MTGTRELPACVWSASELAGAIEDLATRAKFAPHPKESFGQNTVPPSMDEETFVAWVPRVARLMGIEAVPVESTRSGLERTIRFLAPALVRLPVRDGEPRFLAILGSRFGRILALARDGSITRLKPSVICQAIGDRGARSLARRVDRLLDAAGVPSSRRGRAAEALLAAENRGDPVEIGWILRLPADRDLWLQSRCGGIGRLLAGLATTHVAQVALLLAGWGLIAVQALQGRLDAGMVAGWALLMAGQVLSGLGQTAFQGRLAESVSSLVQRRLFAGILRLDPDDIRHRGRGDLLGRALGGFALEEAMLGPGIPSILGGVEWLAAACLLFAGAGGHAVLLLLAWTGMLAVASVRYFRHTDAWTEAEKARTAAEIEFFPKCDEPLDAALARIPRMAARRDRVGQFLLGVGARGWRVVGVAALWPVLVSDDGAPGALALALGGVLLAGLAFDGVVAGLPGLAKAWAAWRALRTLREAASRPEPFGTSAFAGGASSVPLPVNRPVVEVHDASLCFRDRGRPVLDRAGIEIHVADRILLSGSSGAGKSAFARLLAGLCRPDAGLVRVRGLDLETLGAEAWRRRVVLATQEPDNWIFSGSLAFNLLLGLPWPPDADDLAAAEQICGDLGLGSLVRRMPAGIHQIVGEEGWRLSAGEASRVLLGRALLRKADLVIPDGTIDGLDGRTAKMAVKTMLERAKTVILIATTG